jgi:hypothetical protein
MEGEMVDFQFRVAMDTYEQMNGKLKTPPVVYEPVDDPARPGLLRRLLRVVRAWRQGRVALQRAGAVSRG